MVGSGAILAHVEAITKTKNHHDIDWLHSPTPVPPSPSTIPVTPFSRQLEVLVLLLTTHALLSRPQRKQSS